MLLLKKRIKIKFNGVVKTLENLQEKYKFPTLPISTILLSGLLLLDKSKTSIGKPLVNCAYVIPESKPSSLYKDFKAGRGDAQEETS